MFWANARHVRVPAPQKEEEGTAAGCAAAARPPAELRLRLAFCSWRATALVSLRPRPARRRN